MLASVPTLTRLGCKACPLNKADVHTPKMKPTLAREVGGMYFLAEAPGRDEDENTGRPLTGPSGSLLRECIPDPDVPCSFDNVVRDRPPKNRTPTWQEINCCRGHVTKSIEQAKPKLIVGLGGVPLSWMLGSSDLAGMRGRLFAVKVGTHKCWFLPTYHPSFLLRTAYNKKKPLNSRLGHCFRMDIERAFKLLPKLSEPPLVDSAGLSADIKTYDGTAPAHFAAVLQALADAKRAKLKTIDLETHGLRPYGKDARILTIAISYDDTHFSFALDHPKAGWSKAEKIKLLSTLKKLLTDNTIKVAHNAPFELEWLIWRFGKDVVNHAVWHCTMMQAHFLDERRGKQARGSDDKRAAYQSLDFLFKQHFGITYKHLFKLNKKNMAAADLGVTLTYNGVDTKATLMLHHAQVRLLKQNKLYDAYLEALPRQPTVALMQHLGIDVDQAEVSLVKKRLEKEIKGLHWRINELKVVKAYIRDHKEFNPQSDREVLSIFKDYLKRPEVVVKEGDKQRLSVDKGVLGQIDHPLSPLIVQLRNRAKLKSTYCDGMELGVGTIIWPDGKLHTSLNTTFAETGRTSSDEPNLQNFPQRNDAWVRKQIIAPKGHILVAFDYGQLEACTGAMCSQDKYLVKALWEDYDIHMEWSIKLADVCPEMVGGRSGLKDKAVMKGFRSLIKNKLVFPAFFGAANESVCGYLSAATGLDVPQDKIDDIMDEFWTTFSGLKRWQDDLMKHYYKVGWVDTPNGRRHHYPLTRNQAVNHPIQGLACEIVCDAMNRLSFQAVSTGNWSLHPRLNIHDDLTMVIPDNDAILETAIEAIYRVMLSPSYKCVNVPLSVKASIGKNWFEMQEIGQFWSHKDL